MVRTVEKFRIGYIVACCIVVFMYFVVVSFCSIRIHDNDNEAGPDWVPFNESEFLIMIGMAFGQYEGVGAVLPIMEASDAKPIFHWLIGAGLATLCTLHITLSELVYYAYGSEVSEPIIIFQMPQDNWVMIIAEFLFLINVFFSYPLLIYITNYVIDRLVFSGMRYSLGRFWLKNLSRGIVVGAAVTIGYFFYYIIPKIVSVAAVTLGVFVVAITPALLHLMELSADDTYARVTNYLLLAYGCVSSVTLTVLIIYTWDKIGGH